MKINPINILPYILFLIFSEIYQFILVYKTNYRNGDFSSETDFGDNWYVAFTLSITTWIMCYQLIKITNSKNKSILNIKNNNYIVGIFLFNFLITFYGNIGNVLSENKSSMGFLTTIIPINYLILVLAQEEKIKMKFLFECFLLVTIDLYRLLLGGLLKIAYIFLARARKKTFLMILIFSPILFYATNLLVEYKLESRGIDAGKYENLVLDNITSRISVISTFQYGIEDISNLSKSCNGDQYSSQWYAAAISIVPKSMFGIDSPRTFNNCLIDTFLNKKIEDSSVNSPYLLNLYITYKNSIIDFISYLLLTSILLGIIIKMANLLLGYAGLLLKSWVIIEFFATGNILHLTIPLYFLGIIWIYVYINKRYKGA